MGAAPYRRLFGVVIAALALFVSVAPADAQQCVSSCGRGRGVCAMQAHAEMRACLAGCAVSDTQCHTSCMAGLRTAQTACQMSRADCMTTCPTTPAASSTSCVGGCSSTAKTCFMSAFSAGATCVQTCQTAGGSGLQNCLQQCAATIRSSGAQCLAPFQSCVGGCQGQVTGGCFDTIAMECTTEACQPGTPCTQPNEFCSERCTNLPQSGTCLDLGTLQCTNQTCSPTQPCSANQTCVPVCPPPVPQGHCFDPTTKQCTEQECDPLHHCSAANQICTLQCPMATPTPQCSNVPCTGPCVISPTCPPGVPCPEAAFVIRRGQCAPDANSTCGCVLPSPQPTETPGPSPTPQCSDVPCSGDCTINVPFVCPDGHVCNGPNIPVLPGKCTQTSSGSCDCVPVPRPTPTPQCGGPMCGGSCLITPFCPPGEACVVQEGQCAPAADGSCQCMPPSPAPTPTPQCSDPACNGSCVIRAPIPCPLGSECNGSEGGIELQGQCTKSSSGSCECVPVPQPTPTPQCGGAMCSGSCLIVPFCPPGEVCPDIVEEGRCALAADGSCSCMPPSPAPTPTPQCSDRPCSGTCVINPPIPCPPGRICNESDEPIELQGLCTTGANGSCDCVPVQPSPRATPTPQCGGDTCSGSCLIIPFCPPGADCPEWMQKGQCAPAADGSCVCMPPSPRPTPTPQPPQCSDQPCRGTCIIRAPIPCPMDGDCNGSDDGVELQGQCTMSASGSCDCVLVQPTPPATPTPQCSGATCGGQCIIGPVCRPGQPCPEFASRFGACTAEADGTCQCIPVQGPTPTPACTSDADCDDNIGCTADHCDHGVCEHVCICLSADGTSCCGGPGELCVAPCGSDAAGSCGGACPFGSTCESSSSANSACACVSGPGGPCGGNINAPPAICAPGLVCHQSLPDVTGYCEEPNCVPLFMSGCSTTSDCCEPCENGTHAPCGICRNGICEGVPVAQPRPHD